MYSTENKDNVDSYESPLLTARLEQSPNGWFTLRTLRLAMRYPYMFPNPNLGLEMCIAWNPTFEKLCAEIDSLLGKDKRGFCWRQLTQGDGVPAWYWRLAPVLDQQLAMTMVNGQMDLTLVNPNGDPKNELRDAVRGLVNAAIAQVGAPCAICAQANEGVACE